MSEDRTGGLLAREVAVGGVRKPFAALTADDVEANAEVLAGAAGFGHGGRVAGVASAWRELGRRMRERQAAKVAELDPDEIEELARPMWIEPPGGSILP